MHTKTWIKWIVTCGGLGLIPKAPGTFGSVGGLVFSSILFSYLTSLELQLSVLVVCTFFSYWAIREYETLSKKHDEKSVVIDEWVAQSWVVVFFPITAFYLLLGFLLFRFFDILKPFPISWIDKNIHNSFGTLLDDLVAALASILVLLLCKWFI